MAQYSGILLRQNVSDQGVMPRSGGWTASQDIIMAGTQPIRKPEEVFSAAASYAADQTQPVVKNASNYTNGMADAADVTFSAVASNASSHSVLLFQSSAVTGGADVAATAQRVIGWIDTGTNLPVVPNGGDVTVAWDNGANKIFTL